MGFDPMIPHGQVNSAEHYLEALKAARGQSSAKACAKNRPAPGTKGAGFGALEPFEI